MNWDKTSCVRCLFVLLTVAVSVSWGVPPTSPRADDRANGSRQLRKKYRHRIKPNNWPREMRLGPRDQSDEELSKAILSKYGYFRKGKPLGLQAGPAIGASRTRPESDTESAIRMFQNFFGLEQTGRLDKETLALMKKSRCGVADIPEELKTADASNSGRQTPSEFELLGSKWDHLELTWQLSRTTNQLDETVQRETLRRAFNEWRNVAPLEFQEVSGRDQKVDIDIQFGRQDHGDAWPFDGKGWVLAHAFGPGTHELSGDMHIDNDENWAEAGRAEDGSNDLLLVAVHELGHSLGLSHSSSPDAIMYPYYGVTDKIGEDDIRAIESLYGARIERPRPTRRPSKRTTTPRPTRPPVTRRPVTRAPVTRFPQTKSAASTQAPWTTPHPGCEVQFDVVLRDDIKDVYTGIQGNQVYQFNQERILPGYPAALQAVFPGAPANAEAIFTVPEKSATYFVKDKRVWRYQRSTLDREYPKSIPASHFPEAVRFIVSLKDSTGNRRIFVFGRTNWFEYNFDELPTFRPRLHVIAQYWPAITSDVRYVVTGHDTNMYLISQHSHVVLDHFRRTLHGGKQKGHPKWLQPACHMNGPLIGGYSGMTTIHHHHQWSVALVSATTTLLLLLTKF